ncbi:MAG TPA: ABC transporter permease [Candidatus Coprenecus stercoravium]|uniref:ABC transporter permease n=1 Tax=Candidatus Coprenecus stercoravium TaxID=2840735 RepID=A0A9D2K8K9_9BACT|nr:ABC transporter permease [Candidatus Coprenecus stercoravium]
MNLNLFIAKKIRGRGLSSTGNIIACVSVAISIGVIIAAVAISGGFRKEIGKRAAGFTGEILMTAPGADYMTDVYPLRADLSYLSAIRSLPEVKSVSEAAYRPGMIKSGKDVYGLMFKGVDSAYSMEFFADYLTEGVLPDFSGPRMSGQVLISNRLASLLGLEVGDRMTVYFVGDQVRARRLEISGLYDVQLEDIDERMALVDIRQIRRLNGWLGHESSCLEIALEGGGGKVSDKRRDAVYNEIGEIIMTQDKPSDDAVVLRKISEIYPGLFDWLALLDLNVLVVMALMMAVAGFNMISGLLIILFERISMIGLLKSLGMRTSSICKIFIYRGGAIVLKGMLWGNVVSIVLLSVQKWLKPLTLNPVNYFVNFVPVDLNLLHIMAVDVAAFALMLLIMTVPSLFISRVSPDKTLKVN